MSLIACHECSGEISTLAVTCPHCRAPVQPAATPPPQPIAAPVSSPPVTPGQAERWTVGKVVGLLLGACLPFIMLGAVGLAVGFQVGQAYGASASLALILCLGGAGIIGGWGVKFCCCVGRAVERGDFRAFDEFGDEPPRRVVGGVAGGAAAFAVAYLLLAYLLPVLLPGNPAVRSVMTDLGNITERNGDMLNASPDEALRLMTKLLPQVQRVDVSKTPEDFQLAWNRFVFALRELTEYMNFKEATILAKDRPAQRLAVRTQLDTALTDLFAAAGKHLPEVERFIKTLPDERAAMK